MWLFSVDVVCVAWTTAWMGNAPSPTQLMAVREEMWAQAARDRDALEAELGLRHEEERSRFLEEANERASEIIEEVR